MSEFYQLVLVTWVDSTQADRVWFNNRDLMKEVRRSEKERFVSTGYLVHTGRRLLHLASSIHFDEEGEAVGFGTVTTIPRGCVITMKKIKG